MITEVELRESFLLEQFRVFHGEIVALKRSLPRRMEPGATPTETAAPADSIPAGKPSAPIAREAPEAKRDAAHPIRSRLVEVLERQIPESRRRGGEYGVGYYRDAQYAMAALADEIFLTEDWPGREDWRTHLLETELFGTYTAGETIFERLERILKERDPADGEMAAVYLLLLALGFRGKFRDADDGGRIEFYRRQLFALIFQDRPALEREDRKLFPQAYAHTLTRNDGERLPYLRRWLWLMLAVVVAYLAASAVVWETLTADLSREVADLLDRFGGRLR
jgi:type VI secretion system protein ImpK